MAKTRTLQVVISGDPTQLRSAFKRVDAAAESTEKRLHRMGRVGALAFGGLATVAGGAAVVGLKKSADAAIEAEKAQARMVAQLKASGVSYRAHAKQIDEVIQRTSKLAGLDDEDLQDAFTNIVRSTGSVSKGLHGIGLAADIARAKHIDVAKAGQLVGKVASGNVTALSRYGIQIDKNATSSQALAELQKRFSGQAEAYGKTTAGSMERAGVAAENLGEVVGAKLSPLIAKGATALTNLIDRSGQLAGPIRTVTGTIRSSYNTAANAVSSFVRRNRADIDSAINAVRNLGQFFRAVFERIILPAVRAALPGIRQALNGIITVVRGVVRVITGIINGDWARVWRGLKDIVSGALNGVVGLIRGSVGLFSRALVNLAKAAIPAFGRALGGLAHELAEAVRGLISKAPGFGVGVGKALVRGIVNGIKSVPGAIAGAVKGAVGKAGDFFGIGEGLGRQAPARPAATGASTGLMGAQSALAPFAAVGARFGLHVSSGRRPGSITSSGNISYHSSGEAIDMADGRGPDAPKMRFFQYMKSHFGPRLAELIYTPGGAGIKNGRPFTYTGQVAADHYDHVHVAFDTGRAGVGDGIGQAAQAARAAGFRGSDLVTAVAIAGAESRYRNSAANLKYPDHSIGMWQINQLAHHGRFGSDSALHNAFTNARAAYALFRGRGGFGDWSTFNDGSFRAYLGRARQAVIGSRATRPSTGGASAPSGGGGGGGAVDTGPSAHDQRISAQREADAQVTPLDMSLAQADVAIADIQSHPANQARNAVEAMATRGKEKIVGARIRAIRAALKKKGLRASTRLRLTQELAQRLQEHSELGKQVQSLLHPSADAGGDGGGGPADAPEVASGGTVLSGLIDELHAIARAGEMTDAQAQFLIDYRRQQALRGELGPLSNMERLQILGDIREEQAANTAALEEANKKAEEEKAAREAHTKALQDLTDEVKRQTDFATSVSNTSNFQLSKSLADILSGQIVGYGLAGRAMTPGRGVEFAY